MLPISLGEQALCQVVLTGAFPGIDSPVIRSPVFVNNPDTEGLVVQGTESAISSLYRHLTAMRNRGGEEYVWERVSRVATDEIYCRIEANGVRTTPRIVLIETLFRVDAIRWANLCLSPLATLRVVRPSGWALETYVTIPVKENGTVLISA